MIMNDPIADMLTRIRNALIARHDTVTLPASNMKKAIAKILLDEGYVKSIDFIDDDVQGQGLLLREVLLVADVAHRGDDLLHQFEAGEHRLVDLTGLGHRGHTDRLAVAARGEGLPDLLRDEGHEGVQHAHQGIEVSLRGLERGVVDRLSEGGLDHLEVEAREVVPEEAVDLLEGLRDAV